MLIATHYLLSKNWDIFATRCRILLIISKDYFRGGQMRRISKDITKHYQMACSSMSYTPFAFYGLMLSMCLFCLFRLFCYMCVARQKRRQSPTKTYLFLLIRT